MPVRDFFKKETEIDKENYPDAMRQAIDIEIATIPVYLYTYYSIIRVPNQDAIMQDLVQRLVNRKEKPLDFEQARTLAQEWSAVIMVFANRAGAGIVSIAIEEMLHMSLSANVHQATIGPPTFVGQAPTQWPAYLPGHKPPFPINRQALCLDQLKTLLMIESPESIEPPQAGAKKAPIPYVTIGRFYQSIIDFLAKKPKEIVYDTARPQLAPDNGYYAQNNINTNFYNKQHKPNFVNAEDSGDLVFVKDFETASKALHIIKEQGEGASGVKGLGPDNTPTCNSHDVAFDDEKDKELTHFAKLNILWCRLQAIEEQSKALVQDESFDIKKYFVYNVPVNPSTKDYPANIQSISNLLNAVYTYVFLMSESCYKVDKPVQYEIFMGGIHKTMMWILGSLCETIVRKNYVAADGKTYAAAPTFEEYAFNTASSPKSQIQALFAKMFAYYPSMVNIGTRIDSLPNIPMSGEPNASTTVFA
jgi:hypothetical protein